MVCAACQSEFHVKPSRAARGVVRFCSRECRWAGCRPQSPNVTDGYCECGCGTLAPIAKQSHTKFGYVKDQPMRFVRGHQGRKRERYRIEDRGFETPCWTWLLARHQKTGYGLVRVGATKQYAHRASYEQHVGPVPIGLELDHLCRHRDCINPAHLEPVTHAENMRRAVAAGSFSVVPS